MSYQQRISRKPRLRVTWLLMLLGLITTTLPTEAAEHILVGEVSGLGIAAENRIELTRLLRQEINDYAWLQASNYLPDKANKNCLSSQDCRQQLMEKRGATHYLEGALHGLGSMFTVTLKLYSLEKQQSSPWMIKERGKRATVTFAEATKQAIAKLLDQAGLTAKGILRLEGIPAGATIYVDANAIPGKPDKTSRRLQMPPGHHTVRVEKIGYVSAEQTILLTPKSEQTLRFQLKAKPLQTTINTDEFVALQTKIPPAPERPKRRAKKWWLWTLIGGVAASAATVAAISLAGGGEDSTNAIVGGGSSGSGSGSSSGGTGSGGGGSDGPITITTTVTLE